MILRSVVVAAVAYLASAVGARDISPVRSGPNTITYTLNVGERGEFGGFHYEIERVIDGKSAELSIAGGRFHFLVVGAPTAGLVDRGKVQMLGEWEVAGTKKYLGRTMHVVEPRKDAELLEPGAAARRIEQRLAERVAAAAATNREKEAKIRSAVAEIAKPIEDRIKAGTEVWVWGLLGEYTRQKYGASSVRYDDGKLLATDKPIVSIVWTATEFKSKPAKTAELAKAAALPNTPARATHDVAASFELRSGALHLVELRDLGTKQVFPASGQGPAPSTRLYGWHKLLKQLAP